MELICCVCKRVKHDDQWVTESLPEKPGKLSHGYCPECKEAFLAELRRLRAEHTAERSVA